MQVLPVRTRGQPNPPVLSLFILFYLQCHPNLVKIKVRKRGRRRNRRERRKREEPVKCPRNHRAEVMNVGGSRASRMVGVLPGTGAASAIRIVIECVKESASGKGIGAIPTGVNARATRIATDRKTTIGSGATEAMRDPVKVLILRVGRRCDTKVGINIIIISFYFF